MRRPHPSAAATRPYARCWMNWWPTSATSRGARAPCPGTSSATPSSGWNGWRTKCGASPWRARTSNLARWAAASLPHTKRAEHPIQDVVGCHQPDDVLQRAHRRPQMRARHRDLQPRTPGPREPPPPKVGPEAVPVLGQLAPGLGAQDHDVRRSEIPAGYFDAEPLDPVAALSQARPVPQAKRKTAAGVARLR